MFGVHLSTEKKNQKTIQKIVKEANSYEPAIRSLCNQTIRRSFREVSVNFHPDRLPEMLALLREGAGRSIGQKPFDAQLMCSASLFDGMVAEMGTGEGKTLAIAMAAAARASLGHHIHIATANAYLAKRDYEWMRPLYEFFGFSSSFIDNDMPLSNKASAYKTSIIYGKGHDLFLITCGITWPISPKIMYKPGMTLQL